MSFLDNAITVEDVHNCFRNLHNNLEFVGSRSVLEESELKEETDFDFMECWSMEYEEWLNKIGFDKKGINLEYMDDATHSVWVHPFLNAQVVLKHPVHWVSCKKMWDVLKKNPDLFRNYFWKSNPNGEVTRDLVLKRINAFIQFVQIT